MTKTDGGPCEVSHCDCRPAPEGVIFDLPDRGRLRSVSEAAALLKTGPRQVYGLINDGSLTASNPAGRYRVSIPDLEAYVRSTRVTPTQKTPAGAASPAGVGEDTP